MAAIEGSKLVLVRENMGFQEHRFLSFCNPIHTCIRKLEGFILFSFALRIIYTVPQYKLNILSSFFRLFPSAISLAVFPLLFLMSGLAPS